MKQKLKPIHPGSILKEDFLDPLRISQNQLSIAIGVDTRRINAIVLGKRNITPDTALRLGAYFRNGAKVWLNLQQEYDLRVAEKELGPLLKKLGLNSARAV